MPREAPVTTPRKARAFLIMLVSLLAYTAVDLGTKEWAMKHLSRDRPGEKPALCVPSAEGHTPYQRLPLAPQTFIDGVLKLNYAENCGAAFSMLRTAPAALRALLFGVATLAALAALMVMFARGTGGTAFSAAVPLIAAGAIGNLADRLRHGFVVDFFQVDPRLFNYPVFNVADIWIAIGVGLLLIDNLGKSRESRELSSARA